MFFLILDTSTSYFCLGLYKGKEKIAGSIMEQGKAHCAVPLIKKFLQDQNRELSDLAAIGIGLGPGSFTGIRLSALFAEGIMYTKKIPLLSFSSLSLYAPKEDREFLVVRHAFLQGIYIQKGKKIRGNISWDIPKMISSEDLIKYSANFPLISPDLPLLQEKFPSLTWERQRPNLDLVAPVVLNKFLHKEMLSLPIEPYYLRELS